MSDDISVNFIHLSTDKSFTHKVTEEELNALLSDQDLPTGELKDLLGEDDLDEDITEEGGYKTEGERRVRTHFNSMSLTSVDIVKAECANLINMVLDEGGPDARLNQIAATKLEEAAMWAVKAVTAE